MQGVPAPLSLWGFLEDHRRTCDRRRPGIPAARGMTAGEGASGMLPLEAGPGSPSIGEAPQPGAPPPQQWRRRGRRRRAAAAGMGTLMTGLLVRARGVSGLCVLWCHLLSIGIRMISLSTDIPTSIHAGPVSRGPAIGGRIGLHASATSIVRITIGSPARQRLPPPDAAAIGIVLAVGSAPLWHGQRGVWWKEEGRAQRLWWQQPEH